MPGGGWCGAKVDFKGNIARVWCRIGRDGGRWLKASPEEKHPKQIILAALPKSCRVRYTGEAAWLEYGRYACDSMQSCATAASGEHTSCPYSTRGKQPQTVPVRRTSHIGQRVTLGIRGDGTFLGLGSALQRKGSTHATIWLVQRTCTRDDLISTHNLRPPSLPISTTLCLLLPVLSWHFLQRATDCNNQDGRSRSGSWAQAPPHRHRRRFSR